ncbi:hypothetical protein [Streptomyces sp. NPDC054866]
MPSSPGNPLFPSPGKTVVPRMRTLLTTTGSWSRPADSPTMARTVTDGQRAATVRH